MATQGIPVDMELKKVNCNDHDVKIYFRQTQWGVQTLRTGLTKSRPNDCTTTAQCGRPRSPTACTSYLPNYDRTPIISFHWSSLWQCVWVISELRGGKPRGRCASFQCEVLDNQRGRKCEVSEPVSLKADRTTAQRPHSLGDRERPTARTSYLSNYDRTPMISFH